MYSVDPAFKRAYDNRNALQEAMATGTRRAPARYVSGEWRQAGPAPALSEEYRLEGDQDAFGRRSDRSRSSPLRWTVLAGLALATVGLGYKMGRAQYDMHRRCYSDVLAPREQ